MKIRLHGTEEECREAVELLGKHHAGPVGQRAVPGPRAQRAGPGLHRGDTARWPVSAPAGQRCAWPGCQVTAKRGRLMCHRDWNRLPAQLRARIWEHYRARPERADVLTGIPRRAARRARLRQAGQRGGRAAGRDAGAGRARPGGAMVSAVRTLAAGTVLSLAAVAAIASQDPGRRRSRACRPGIRWPRTWRWPRRRPGTAWSCSPWSRSSSPCASS